MKKIKNIRLTQRVPEILDLRIVVIILLLISISLTSHFSFAQSITRTQIHNKARPFTTYTFTASSSNIYNNVNCSAVGNISTPSWVAVGNNTVGMPYCWGGFSSLSSFTSSLLGGKSAGDNDCTTSGDCCESCALGVDCSGFVSHAWGLTTKYSTNTIPSISTSYTSALQVKQGDVFNLAGSHVRLVDTNYATGTFLLMESSAADWKVSYRSYTASQLTSYIPRWYVNVDTIGAVCRKTYASLPYTTSFDNTWTMDSCNNGAQRSPDVYWKSSIGGTTPTGDDFWHRDDYTGTDWTLPTNGAYTPASSSGSYSARFHNEPPPAGSTGAMDLYINLSPAGSKTIQFDYIHNESSPSPFSFNVMLSTDGGSTFTNLYAITTASVGAWTTQTVSTTATSATSVLRFIVTDKGSHDVGIDNLSVSLTSSTGLNELGAMNDEVNIFPNPNNGVFNLTNSQFDNEKTNNVEIYNTIGECVHRQIATSANCQIDVSGLAKGVYLFIATSGSKQFRKKIVIN
ncbi:MAG: T9SS type A sorting domain-containing protein [Bacteroidia bacterium]